MAVERVAQEASRRGGQLLEGIDTPPPARLNRHDLVEFRRGGLDALAKRSTERSARIVPRRRACSRRSTTSRGRPQLQLSGACAHGSSPRGAGWTEIEARTVPALGGAAESAPTGAAPSEGVWPCRAIGRQGGCVPGNATPAGNMLLRPTIVSSGGLARVPVILGELATAARIGHSGATPSRRLLKPRSGAAAREGRRSAARRWQRASSMITDRRQAEAARGVAHPAGPLRSFRTSLDALAEGAG